MSGHTIDLTDTTSSPPSGRPEREAVWCVCASHGEYSDRSEWTVAVRRTEADARAFVDTFATAVQQIKPYVDRGGEDGWWERENRWLKATWRKIAKTLRDADAFDPTTYYKPADVTLYVAGPFKLPPLSDGALGRQDDAPQPSGMNNNHVRQALAKTVAEGDETS